MSEETTAPESNTEQQVQYSDVEQLALEKGWKPKEEYQGDPGKWRSAETFLALEEPLKRIENQSKELKQVRAALEALKTHHTKVKETEYNRALKSLQDARRQAMINGETEQALALEDKLEEIKAEKEQVTRDLQNVQVQEPQQNVHPAFQAWIDKNSWYESNKAMRAVADRLGIEYHNEGYSQAEVLKKVEEDIRKEFAHKFETPEQRKRPAMAVEPTKRTGRSSSQEFELSEDERQIMQKFVRQGVMTKEEYIAELKRVKGA